MLGSLAMVLAIGFDPFIQNLVHYVPGSIESPSESALLASTSLYNTVGPLAGGNRMSAWIRSIFKKILTEYDSVLRGSHYEGKRV